VEEGAGRLARTKKWGKGPRKAASRGIGDDGRSGQGHCDCLVCMTFCFLKPDAVRSASGLLCPRIAESRACMSILVLSVPSGEERETQPLVAQEGGP
jgi:hypothetical protein